MSLHASKIAVTIDAELLHRLDSFVRAHAFKNRSQAVQQAVVEIVKRLEHRRLAEECAKLDLTEEQALANEQLPMDPSEWSEY